MERRELYEPEDIEQLLIERPYDELLEMERAFVLRHLSGRDEYEAMRALLLKVHDDDAHMAPIDAEPSVRAHVLDVFRAEQRPQWRIWLNSVRAFLLPKEASAMWRPALALGSVALLAWLVVINAGRSNEAKVAQLAELKETTVTETKNIADEKAATETTASGQAQEGIASPQEDVRSQQEQTTVNTVTFTDAVAADATADQPMVMHDLNAAVASKAEVEESPAAPPPATEAEMDVALTEEQAKENADAEVKALTLPGAVAGRLDTVSIASGTATHLVTSNELSTNYSLTNAADIQTVGSVSTKSVQRFTEREKSKKQEERKRSMAWASGNMDDSATADAGAYIDLLRAAW